MKKLIAVAAILFLSGQTQAQGLKGLLNKARETINGKTAAAGLSNEDIVAGLKEALATGSAKGAAALSQADGFFANAALKILLPAEAKKVESALRAAGLGKQADDAILSMNRAAEDACKSAAPIFINAVKQMSFKDALGILRGSDTAATAYLRTGTHTELTSAFRPVIEQSLTKVDATRYWNTLMTTYNRFSLQKINPDLTAYVTEKALNGIFVQVAAEEKNIRENPVARTSDMLKKVFAK
ncbi:DUF4197 domain-containing protein [Sediminibacterium soli]|uniref:DUF4197 domain-containing protein n=1 Tax=Sediminibacterium soli TaxID=2698829 RepID=UPI0013797F80|nr:DUF4197 domain-containing protein [Sediminibacterium soli]NCI46654.1 DUF4197 domain-containing protein [Sediminibacterium soli]